MFFKKITLYFGIEAKKGAELCKTDISETNICHWRNGQNSLFPCKTTNKYFMEMLLKLYCAK